MVKPTIRLYTYYHCTKSANHACNQKSISAVDLERQIVAFLNRIQISEDFKAFAYKYVHELHEKEKNSRNDILKSQQKAYSDCISRLDCLIKLKTTPGNNDGHLLSDDEYWSQRTEILKEKSRLEELLRDTGYRVEHSLRLTEQTFDFARNAGLWFASGDIQTKKTILNGIKSAILLKDKILTIEPIEPFMIIEAFQRNQQGVDYGPIEPKTALVPQAQNAKNDPSDSRVLSDVNLTGKLQHEYQDIVKKVYLFYRGVCVSPDFVLARWYFLDHDKSVSFTE
jgi:hypothetical protein